jgi:hypothetical protein
MLVPAESTPSANVGLLLVKCEPPESPGSEQKLVWSIPRMVVPSPSVTVTLVASTVPQSAPPNMPPVVRPLWQVAMFTVAEPGRETWM